MPKIAKVVVPISLNKEFDYFCPPGLDLKKGMRVLVDFNHKKRVGIVVAIASKSNILKLKPIIDVLDSQVLLDDERLNFAKRLSDLYPYPQGEFLFMMIPPYLKKPKKLNLQINKDTGNVKALGESKFIKADSFKERYKLWKDIIREKLKKGSVLICFPQLTYLESARDIISVDFPNQVKIIHSQEKEKDLFSNWEKTRKNSLILGTRVAIFYYPLDLELIIVEEENSPYYFQEEKPYHNLLDVAYNLSALKGVDLILSSDYPSLVTYKHIKDGKVKLIDKGGSDRNVKIVNLPEFSKNKVIGPVLIELLRKTIGDDKKAVILWNRKGFARVISCSSCGYIFKCEHCSSFLQSSLKSEEGVCPYCQKNYFLPRICNQCNNGYLKSKGYGIQRIESTLKRIFPEARVANFSDVCSSTQIILSTSKILSHLYEPMKFDKGFVLDADLFLNHIDYDTTFNAFLYLKKLLFMFRDSLYVFTRHKDYYLFKHLNESWRDFYESELQFRKKSQLPPFGLIVKITLRAKNEKALLKRIKDLYNRLEKRCKEAYGPFEEKPFKLRDKFRYSIIIKAEQTSQSREIVKEEIERFRTSSMQMAVSLR